MCKYADEGKFRITNYELRITIYDIMDDQKIPVFKKWRHWYILVISFLILEIILFYLFTNYFA